MDFHFGTPARLERQIAQDLMASQSDFDLSVPGCNTQDISASIARTPFAPSQQHNLSFSRQSDASESSTPHRNKASLRGLDTPKQPVSLAAAIKNAQQYQSRPTTSDNTPSLSPSEKQQGDQYDPSAPNDHQTLGLPSSSSASLISESPQSPRYPDPYHHIRSVSPPLTSTPQRPGPSSTIGSRTRTTVTLRPGKAGIHRSSSFQNDTTAGSASRATRSAPSASAVLDDLTESSIASQDEQDREYDSDKATQHPASNGSTSREPDFVVVDAQPQEAKDAPAVQEAASHGGAMLAEKPLASEKIVDWRQRRAERRRLVQKDESAIDDDESQIETDVAEPPSADQRTTSGTSRSQPHAFETTMRTTTEVEDTATAYSSPAAARLARQVFNLPARAETTAVGTPVRSSQADQASTPKAGPSSVEQDRMKQYLLNSVKATEKLGSKTRRPSDAHLQAIERLKVQSQLHQTPGSRSDGDLADRDESSAFSSLPTPRRKMDRLGKANTIAAGRTPLPRGGVAELLRRGALLSVSDSSTGSGMLPGAEIPESRPRQDEDQQSAIGSSTVSSETSSIDLAAAPNGSRHGTLGLRANTSFPGLGAAEAGTEANSVARPRVDAAKLALYQSKLNARLDAENEELKRERDQLLRRVQELENLARSGGAVDAKSDSDLKQELEAEQQRSAALDKEAQELADLLDDKEREIESLQAKVQTRVDRGDGDNRTEENVEDLRFQGEELQALLNEREEDVQDLENRLEQERKHMEEQVQQAKAYSFETLDKVEAARDEALDKVKLLEADLAASNGECQRLKLMITDDKGSNQTSSSAALRARLADSEQRRREVERENDQLSVKVASLEGKLLKVERDLEDSRLRSDDAKSSSSTENIKDERIRMLQDQKSELEKRVRQYREMISAGVGQNLSSLSHDADGKEESAAKDPVTPGRALAASSPMHKSVMSLRNISAVKTPRSPGPLSDASWLYNESSLGAAGVVERIAYLEGALDEANASIDAKLQQLDDAGVAHLTLAERLANANERIAELEAEIERLRMLGGTNSTANTTSPSKSVIHRQKVFADVHAQLEALKSRWASDHEKLQMREKDVERRERELQDRGVEKRQYREVLAELNKFKEAASSLQHDLKHESTKQKDMIAESRATSQQRSSIEGTLSRTQAELEMVKRKLNEKMGGLEDLSRQYLERSVQKTDGSASRRNAMERQLEDLATQFQEAQAEVEMLKNERTDLLSHRAELHRKYASTNEKFERMQVELAGSRATLSAHQAQLDEQIEQMEAIHAALRAKKAAFEQVAGDRDRLRAERDEIVRDVGTFEQELRKLRREADKQGQDLEILRAEREQAQRQRAEEDREKDRQRAEFMVQVQTLVAQLKSKTHEVDRIKDKLDDLERSRMTAPPPYAETQAMAQLKHLHSQESKGLMLQIQYLKLKLFREMDLRTDLSHQKQYICLLLKGLTRTDHEVGKLIFDLRIESDKRQVDRMRAVQSAPARRWRKILTVVRAVARMKGLASKMDFALDLKKSLQKAHLEVQSRRSYNAAS